ncbi:MAG: creatininase family protein [Cyclobacteriaceae bacterium]|nr:creatininase family protein [Cyclobacteriaceae bacterium]
MKAGVTSFLVLCLLLFPGLASAQDDSNKAIFIETKPWTEARKLLADTTIVVIPLGAQSKEHGPHLQLRNDFLIAEYLKNRIARTQPVAIYPTINYHYYPAFLEYAGSTSLQLETSYSMIIDICRVISAHGPRKFYILNTGVSTLLPLKIAQESLARQGIQMTYTDILNVAGEAEKRIKQQPAGTHADEIETSMMLYMYPETVDMSKAAKDIPSVDGPGPLTLDPKNQNGRYSPTGIYGDATLASAEKGKIVVEAMVEGINREINSLRGLPIPVQQRVPADYAKMTGTYRLSATEKIVVSVESGRLMVEGKGPRKVELVTQSENSFSAGTRGRLVFFRDENGGYSTVYLNWEGKDFLGRK